MTLTANPTKALSTNEWALVAWQSITEPGDILAGHLRTELGAERTIQMIADRTPLADWISALSYKPEHLARSLDYWQSKYNEEHIARIIDQSHILELELLTPEHPHWPSHLADLGPAAPSALWAKGNTSKLVHLERSATITGSRAATSYGTEVTAMLADALAANSAAIVSGGSFGIEAQALRTALAANAPTVAITTGGLGRDYPAAHADLYKRVSDQGVVLSESPIGNTPTRWRMLQRNRLLATLSTATIVVEAGARSGAINTAAHASILGRALGAVPGHILSHHSAGCHRILTEFSARLIDAPDRAVELTRR